jgi:hypothetical protein
MPGLSVQSSIPANAGPAQRVRQSLKRIFKGPIFWGALLILSAIAWVLLLTFMPRRGVVAAVVIALAGSSITLL